MDSNRCNTISADSPLLESMDPIANHNLDKQWLWILEGRPSKQNYIRNKVGRRAELRKCVQHPNLARASVASCERRTLRKAGVWSAPTYTLGLRTDSGYREFLSRACEERPRQVQRIPIRIGEQSVPLELHLCGQSALRGNLDRSICRRVLRIRRLCGQSPHP